LKANNSLLYHSYIIHSVAHDWRTKKPVIYRATKQWFINIKTIHTNLLESLNNVSFINNNNNR
jgi:isoleucyl-tRNA synthetase